MSIKYKTFKISNLQFKEVKQGDPFASFDAYGSTFGGPPDSYGDVVDPGAFQRTCNSWAEKIKSGKLAPMLWQHQYDNPIGGYGSMAEDSHGLKVSGEINLKVQKGEECYALMKQGVINALSIGYKTMQERACDKCADSDEPHNHLMEVKLFELSPVTFPANENALVTAVKSREFIQGLDAVMEYLQKLRTNPQLLHLVSEGPENHLSEVDEFLKALKQELKTF
jgi:uncharacterized protein